MRSNTCRAIHSGCGGTIGWRVEDSRVANPADLIGSPCMAGPLTATRECVQPRGGRPPGRQQDWIFPTPRYTYVCLIETPTNLRPQCPVRRGIPGSTTCGRSSTRYSRRCRGQPLARRLTAPWVRPEQNWAGRPLRRHAAAPGRSGCATVSACQWISRPPPISRVTSGILAGACMTIPRCPPRSSPPPGVSSVECHRPKLGRISNCRRPTRPSLPPARSAASPKHSFGSTVRQAANGTATDRSASPARPGCVESTTLDRCLAPRNLLTSFVWHFARLLEACCASRIGVRTMLQPAAS
jgi:hypothetical protein